MSIFDPQSDYNKHQADCDCEDKSSCTCEAEDCSCCPTGLVAVVDSEGNISCLTPNDAACFTVENHIPAQGFQKVFTTAGKYIGDMTIADALAYYTAFGTVTPVVPPGILNPVTIDAISLAAPAPAGTTQAPVDFQVDRITCNDPVVVTFAGGTPAGFSFFASAVSVTILGTESILNGDGIEITDVVAPAVYAIDLVYSSCGNTKVRTINVTVT